MQWRDDITLLSVRSVITSSLGAPLISFLLPPTR
jgi:hypothetical protein